MKKNLGLILAVMLATGAVAQTDTNSAPPPLPAPGGAPPPAAAPAMTPVAPLAPAPAPDMSASTNAPAKKTLKKRHKAKRPAIIEAPGAPFTENELAASKQNNVNVRAQARINSEVVYKLQQGDTVTVMKEVVLPHPKTDEPANWVQIILPASTPVWVSGGYLDSNDVVKPSKLNVRSGPGENFSVVGVLHKGDAVKSLHTKEGWTQIEAPTNAFGFVAAHLLAHKEAAPPAVDLTSTPPVVTPMPAGGETAVTPASGAPGSTTPGTGSGPGAGAGTPIVTPMPEPAPSGPPPTRIVTREGAVGDTVSIQAPTYFELDSLDDGKPIDYLYTTSPNLVLEHWRNRRVLVTGEESLDERWPNTPVLTIERIQVVK
jgi:uncharacterized protein YgiM (DUF1202 family)